MRRLLRDIAEGKALGDTTTLADPAVVAKLKANYEEEYRLGGCCQCRCSRVPVTGLEHAE